MDTTQIFSKEDGRPILNTIEMKLLDEKVKRNNWVNCLGNAREPLDFETDVSVIFDMCILDYHASYSCICVVDF